MAAQELSPLSPGFEILRLYRRFWWPSPLARPWLWRWRVVAYEYRVDGRRVDIHTLGDPNARPD